MELNTCVCKTSEGYYLDTSTTPHSCIPCSVANCLTCLGGPTLCDGGGCRLNFQVNVPRDTCSCAVGQGFRLESPTVCDPCQVVGCTNCSTSKTQCEVTGCGANFIRTNATTCTCPAAGFRLNTSVFPNTCESCDVVGCTNCSTNKT